MYPILLNFAPARGSRPCGRLGWWDEWGLWGSSRGGTFTSGRDCAPGLWDAMKLIGGGPLAFGLYLYPFGLGLFSLIRP